MKRNFSHTVPTMFALAKETERFLASLPAEFTKKEFEAAYKALSDRHPLSLTTCRKYGFIVIARTEPATYTKEETVWVDAKGRKYTYDEMDMMDKRTIAMLFDYPKYATEWVSLYRLPNEEVSVEHPCERNIFRFDMEKFKRFLRENA